MIELEILKIINFDLTYLKNPNPIYLGVKYYLIYWMSHRCNKKKCVLFISHLAIDIENWNLYLKYNGVISLDIEILILLIICVQS